MWYHPASQWTSTASVGVVLSSISMYTEAPLVMPRIYAPHEYCVKRVKFSQVAEGSEAKAIDLDLKVMSWGFIWNTHQQLHLLPSRKLYDGNDICLYRQSKTVTVWRATNFFIVNHWLKHKVQSLCQCVNTPVRIPLMILLSGIIWNWSVCWYPIKSCSCSPNVYLLYAAAAAASATVAAAAAENCLLHLISHRSSILRASQWSFPPFTLVFLTPPEARVGWDIPQLPLLLRFHPFCLFYSTFSGKKCLQGSPWSAHLFLVGHFKQKEANRYGWVTFKSINIWQTSTCTPLKPNIITLGQSNNDLSYFNRNASMQPA